MKSGTRAIFRRGLGEVTGRSGVDVLEGREGFDAVVEMKSLSPGGSYSKSYWNQPGAGVSKVFSKKIDRVTVLENKGGRACRSRDGVDPFTEIDSGYSTDRANGRELRVWGGCHGIFGVVLEGGGLAGRYRVESNKIKDFLSLLDIGQVPCNEAIPSTINQNLPAPSEDADSETHSEYSRYLNLLRNELQLARDACAAQQTAGGGGGTSPGTHTGGAGGSAQTGDPADIYAPYDPNAGYADPYTPGPSGGTDGWGSPFTPTPQAGMSKRKLAIGAGGAIAVGLIAFAILRRRKKSRSKR